MASVSNAAFRGSVFKLDAAVPADAQTPGYDDDEVEYCFIKHVNSMGRFDFKQYDIFVLYTVTSNNLKIRMRSSLVAFVVRRILFQYHLFNETLFHGTKLQITYCLFLLQAFLALDSALAPAPFNFLEASRLGQPTVIIDGNGHISAKSLQTRGFASVKGALNVQGPAILGGLGASVAAGDSITIDVCAVKTQVFLKNSSKN